MQTTVESDQTIPPAAKKKDSFFDFLKELPILIVVAFAIALLIKTFLAQAFFIPSGSMENTLLVGDRVLVEKVTYRIRDPEYSDIVVFRSPTASEVPKVDRGLVRNFFYGLAEGLGLRSSERDFIKRVIATEGQEVKVQQGAVYVDGKKLTEPYLRDQSPLPDYGPTKVPNGRIFVMGDNRFNSQDSRAFGPITEESIIGRAFVLVWPPARVGGMG